MNRQKGKGRYGNTAVYTLLVLLSAFWVFPFLYLVMQSFRGEPGVTTDYFFPKVWTVRNYVELWTDTQFFNFRKWYLNTLLVSLAVAVIQSAVVLSTSYALSRLRFKMRRPLMNLILLLGMFPGFMSMTAVYFVLKELALTQSLVGLVIVYTAGSAMQYYISKGFFDTLPKSLDEAARIDGANRHTVFFKIILPLAKPIIVYTVLVAFTMPWGEYMYSSLLMLGNSDKFNVALGLQQMITRENSYRYFTRFCAGAVCVSLPNAILFFLLQRYYVEGVTGGAVK
ncbi:MAG: sugar ABC transporter permease [Clostridia bacterium]|nr:sugar ABC transporter permease [Clostridia bacterium]